MEGDGGYLHVAEYLLSFDPKLRRVVRRTKSSSARNWCRNSIASAWFFRRAANSSCCFSRKLQASVGIGASLNLAAKECVDQIQHKLKNEIFEDKFDAGFKWSFPPKSFGNFHSVNHECIKR